MEAIHRQLVVSRKAIYGRILAVIQTIMNLMIQLKKAESKGITVDPGEKKDADKLDELYSQTKAVADAAKDSAEISKAAAETSKDLLNKTTAAAQQAAASAASASYALGPDESGRLSFFIKKST